MSTTTEPPSGCQPHIFRRNGRLVTRSVEIARTTDQPHVLIAATIERLCRVRPQAFGPAHCELAHQNA